jgi:signal transduction histidine kinase/DNA-binding response OmpR family regulator
MVVTWKGACVSQPNKKDDTVSLLLVESNAQDVRSIRDLLDHLPDGLVALQHASTLAAGLDLLSGQQVDAILLDLQLPDSQGPDTFYALQPHCPTVPVLLLSDTDDEAVATQTAKHGAQDYLIKEDLTSRSLLRAVRYGIDRHRLAQELAEKNLELRESDQRHRAIIESHADGVVIVDSRGRILFANPSAHELYAAAPGTLTGTSFGIPHPSADVGEISIMRPMGAHRVAEMRVTQTVWHHTDVFLVALRDTTARSDSEAAITLYRDHLQELVFRRTEQLSRINDHLNQEIQDHEQTEASLRDAVEKLETHNQMQTDFVSNVSHELKTPLASIEYAVDNLLNGIVGESPERVERYLTMIREDVTRLGETVGDILDVSRLDAKTLVLSRIRLHLSRLVLHAVSSVQDQALKKGHHITFLAKHTSPFAEVDPGKIERVILNILSNAIKYGEGNGLIEVRLTVPADAPDTIAISVSDNGPGIPPEHINRVCDRYYRVGQHVSGTGLGLSLCKEIIELHGGKLKVESPAPDQQKGTCVTINLPVCTPSKVLLVDDEAMVRTLAAEQLTVHGYSVTSCGDAAEALEIMKSMHTDVLVVDIILPGMGGIDLISQIKIDENLHELPIVAITGAILDAEKQDVLDSFSIPVITKPWQVEDFMTAIENTIAGRDLPKARHRGISA